MNLLNYFFYPFQLLIYLIKLSLWKLRHIQHTLNSVPSRSSRVRSAKPRFRLLFASVLLIALLPLAYFLTTRPSQTDAWFNGSWAFRKAIKITNNTTAETNVFISFDEANVFDTSDSTKFQVDCNDLRFTTQGGQLLSYYIVGGCGTASTDIDVLLPAFPAGEQVIYLYYGNPSAIGVASTTAFATEASNYTIGTPSSEQTTTAPLAAYSLNEGTDNACSGGINDVCDGSGRGHDGEKTGASWTNPSQCHEGSCLSFDGTDDTVTVLTTVSGIKAVSFWVRLSSITSTQELLALNASDYLTSVNGTVTAAGFGTETIYVDGLPGTTLTQNTWHHVEVTTSSSLSGSGITLGKANGAFGQVFLDEIHFYGQERSPDQVKVDFNQSGNTLGLPSQDWLTDGLVGYWKMDEAGWNGTSGEVVDSSGNETNGTALGAAVAAGYFGNAGSFDGDDDYIQINRTNLDTYSYSIWLKAHNSVDDTQVIIASSMNSGNSCHLLRYTLSNNAITFTGQSGGNITYVNDLSSWTLVTATNDSLTNISALYINGQKVASSTAITCTGSAQNLYRIGRSTYDGHASDFNGLIDEVRLYSRSLSPQEIASLYRWAPGPSLHYSFDQPVDFITTTESRVPLGGQSDITSASWTTLTDSPIFSFDASKYSGTLTPTFEATLHTQSGGNTVSARLIQCTSSSDCTTGTAVSGSTLTHTGNTTWTHKTSGTLSLTSGQNYAVQVMMDAGTGDLASARLNLTQSDPSGISATELLFPFITAISTDTDSTYTLQGIDLTYPYNQIGSIIKTSYFESTLKSSAGSGSVQLYNTTTPGAVANSELTANSASYSRQKSAAIILPSANNPLDVQIKNTASDTTSVASSWLLSDISATSALPSLQQIFPLSHSLYSAATTSAAPIDNSLGTFRFNPNDFTDSSAYLEAVMKKVDGGNGETGAEVARYMAIDCVSSTDCKMVYNDYSEAAIKFKDCDDASCNTGTITILDGQAGCVLAGCSPTDTIIYQLDIDCSAGTNDCKVVYFNYTDGDLYFADCDDGTCSSGTTTLLDGNVGCSLTGCATASRVGEYVSLDCSNGATDCKISYNIYNGNDLIFADCDNATCSSGTRTVLDGVVGCSLTNCSTTANSGYYTSLDCSNGSADCKITFNNFSTNDLMFADCDNATCSAGTISLLAGGSGCTLSGCSTTNNMGSYHSLDCSNGSDDCKISYYASTGGDLYFGDCDNATCSSGTSTLLDGAAGCVITGCTSTSYTGYYNEIDCTGGTDDCKVIYDNPSVYATYFVDCDDATCSTGSTNMTDGKTGCSLTGCSYFDNPWYDLDLDCSAGATDCKIMSRRNYSGDLYFSDCDNATCTSGYITAIDGHGPNNRSTGYYTSQFCPTPDNCKIAYYDTGNSALYFKDCDDLTCLTGTITLVDGAPGCTLTGCLTTGHAGYQVVLDCTNGPDDCKIAYNDSGTDSLRFADCDNETCSLGTATTLDGDTGCSLTNCSTTSKTGRELSIDCTNGADDCKIAYSNYPDYDLFFADCDNTTCSSGTRTLLDGNSGCTLTNCATTGDFGQFIALDCSHGADNCKISYYGYTGGNLYFADCDNTTCSSGTRTLLDGAASCALTGCSTSHNTGYYTSLDCSNGPDDCKISYYNYTSYDLVFADCDSETCNSGTRTLLDGAAGCVLPGCSTTADVGWYSTPSSIDCRHGSNDCRIAYHHYNNGDLYYANCNNSTCTSGSRTLLDGYTGCALTGCSTTTTVGYHSSLDCSAGESNCKITYHNYGNGNLSFANCTNADCTSGTVSTADDGNETVYSRLYDTAGNPVGNPIMVPSTQASDYTTIRSVYPLTLASGTDYTIRTFSSNPYTTTYLKEARLIINQEPNPVLFDISGNGNNANLHSFPASGWQPGKYGKAAELNGSTSYARSASLPVPTSATAYTFEAWVKQGSLSSGTVIAQRSTTSADQILGELSLDASGYPSFVVSDGTATATATSTTAITPNTWYHLVGIRDGGSVSLYLNASQVATATYTGGTITTDVFELGRRNAGGTYSNYFSGSLDDVRVYPYIRTPAQLSQDKEATSPSTIGSSSAGGIPKPIAHWSFDEQQGQTTHDKAGNNTGTLGATSGSSTDDPTWKTATDCKINGCLSFDGGDYIFKSHTNELQPIDYSISLWMKTSTSHSDNDMIAKNDGGSIPYPYAIRIINDKPRLVIYDLTNNPAATGTTSVNDGAWHHIVGVRDTTSGTLKIYVDGKLENSATDTTTGTVTNSSAYRIGSRTGGAMFYTGILDEVKIYNFALTPSQVALDMNAGRSTSFGVGAPSEAALLNDGEGNPPIAYWELNEGTGTSNVVDKSGNGYSLTMNGSMTNSNWVPGKFGSGLDFDDINDSLSMASPPVFMDDSFTFMAWLNADNLDDEQGIMGEGSPWSVDTKGFAFAYNSTGTLFTRLNNGTGTYLDAVTAIPNITGKWHHVALVVTDDTSLSYYLDGVNVGTHNISTQAGSYDNGTLYLARYAGSSVFFDGKMDEIKIYNYARTPAQIAFEYNKGKPVGHWKFDDCQGTTAYDVSGNNFHGTITAGDASGTNDSVGTCAGSAGEMWADGVTGKFNGAIEFDGTNDFVSVGDTSRSDIQTLAFWVKPASTTQSLLQLSASDSVTISSGLMTVNGFGSEAIYVDGVQSSNLPDTNWHHITITTSTGITANTVEFGRVGSSYYTGFLDDVRIYNYALSPSQIKNVVNGGHAIEFGPAEGSQ